jgi:hypothetical protein
MDEQSKRRSRSPGSPSRYRYRYRYGKKQSVSFLFFRGGRWRRSHILRSCVHAFDFNSNSTKLLADTFAEIVFHPNVFVKVGGVTVD